MSHFIVLFILPKEIQNRHKTYIIQHINDVLFNFNEENEKAKETFLDWYRIGGRYNGIITGKALNSEDGFNSGKEYEVLEKNMVMFKNMNFPSEWGLPDHVITPDGLHHRANEMGWWGITRNPKPEDEWKKEYSEIQLKYAEHMIVALDCHV
jgi:hypothetical protein